MTETTSTKLQRLQDKKEFLKQQLKELDKKQKAEQRRLSQKERKEHSRKLIILGAAFEKTGLDEMIDYDFETAVGMLVEIKAKAGSNTDFENYKKQGRVFIENTKQKNQD